MGAAAAACGNGGMLLPDSRRVGFSTAVPAAAGAPSGSLYSVISYIYETERPTGQAHGIPFSIACVMPPYLLTPPESSQSEPVGSPAA